MNKVMLKNWLLRVTVIVAVIPLTLWAYEIIAEREWLRAHSAPGLLIDVGGYKMHLRCTGAGIPTVMLEAGVGDFSLVWNDIQAVLSQEVRTCSYDRAGLGWSDRGPFPRDPEHEAAELHQLLQRAHVSPPYILVGHSYGGDVVRVYAGHFPDQLAGVVLVEASNEDKWSMIPGMLQTWRVYNEECRKDVWRARFGWLRFRHDALPPGYPQEVRSLAESLTYMQNGTVTTCEEYASLIGAGPSQVGSIRSIGNVPLIVISAGKNIFEGLTSVPQREAGAVWKQLQAESLHLSSSSNVVIAEDSGHYVQLDQPQVLIQQIMTLVKQTKSVH
jgi:pimeloyl-ACP methyl ester carboxylesterase